MMNTNTLFLISFPLLGLLVFAVSFVFKSQLVKMMLRASGVTFIFIGLLPALFGFLMFQFLILIPVVYVISAYIFRPRKNI